VTPTLDRVKASFFALVGAAQPRTPYLGLYAGTVLSQSGDSVDLRMDDPRVPGVAGLPLTVGLPGSKVSFAAGARMLVVFENGDPAKPRAIGWDDASGATVIALTLGSRDAIEALVMGTSFRAAQDAMLSALALAFGTLAAACTSAPLLALKPGFLAAQLAIQTFQQSAALANGFLSQIVRTA
jgi:hypothetical protein